MKTLKIILICATLIFSSLSALAHEYKKGSLIIDHPIARETPPGVKVGAGYLKITNNGNEDDKLINISGDISPVIQIHTMSIIDNVMKMKEIEGGLVIPAGDSIQLQAGGEHLMFMNLPQQLKDGEEYKVVLVFEKAGEVEVTFNVEKHKEDEHAGHNKHESSKKTDHQGHDSKPKKHKH